MLTVGQATALNPLMVKLLTPLAESVAQLPAQIEAGTNEAVMVGVEDTVTNTVFCPTQPPLPP